jgi:hypothetical protein
MVVVYAAHTQTAVLFLDEKGICQRVRGGVTAEVEKLVGAQFVASLDVSAPGALVGEPRPGVPMLFAHVDTGGRISILRTAPLVRFEELAAVTTGSTASGVVEHGERPASRASSVPPPVSQSRPMAAPDTAPTAFRPRLEDLAPRGRMTPPPPTAAPPPPRSAPPSAANNYAPPVRAPGSARPGLQLRKLARG